jgi:hypothetical protein
MSATTCALPQRLPRWGGSREACLPLSAARTAASLPFSAACFTATRRVFDALFI